MLTACGKDKTTEVVTDDVTTQNETEESAKAEAQKSEETYSEIQNTENSQEAIQDSEVIASHFVKLLEGDEPSRECHMIIPMDEKAKLIGTREMYSSEIEGDISYAKDGNVSGKITVYMNVSEDDQLTVNTIGEGETLISLWDIYNRVK